MDGAGSYSVAHRAGLLPTELTGMWGWILLRSPHQGRGSPPGPTPTKQRPDASPGRTGPEAMLGAGLKGNSVGTGAGLRCIGGGKSLRTQNPGVWTAT